MKLPLEISSKSDFLSNMSVPNDELASQNLISDPEEIEDSLASDFSAIKRKNELKRSRQPHQNINYEGGSSGSGNAVDRKSQNNQQDVKTNGFGNHHDDHLRARHRDGYVDHNDVQVTEKDNLQRSLEAHFDQERPCQKSLRDSAVRVDLNCSK